MINALMILLLCQLIGELIVQLARWPIPGPVIGLMLLFVALVIRGQVKDSLRTTSLTLLSHLALLFVPAGVGIMLYAERVAREGWVILLAIFLSSLLSMAITALVMNALFRWMNRSFIR